LIEKGAAEPLIRLKGQIPKVEAERSIEEDMCLQIINSGRLMYKRNESLRIEIPKGQTRGGDPDRRFRRKGVHRSSTLEDWRTEKIRV
jgi:hypothetical protein